MTHKLSDIKDGKGYCSLCGKVVPVVERTMFGRKRLVCARGLQISAKKRVRRVTERRREARREKTVAKRIAELAGFAFRRACWLRDNKRCVACGKEGELGVGKQFLQIHHIVRRSQSKRLLYVVNNGITLCAGHHQYADLDAVWCLGLISHGRATSLILERRSSEKPPRPVDALIAIMSLDHIWRDAPEIKDKIIADAKALGVEINA